MIEFSFTEAQQEIKKTVADFAKKELLPKYSYWDRHNLFPQEQWEKMGEVGLIGLRISEKYDGQGLDCVTTGVVIEEVAKGDFNCAYAAIMGSLMGEIMEKYADEDIQKEWIPDLAKGKKVVALALTEPGGGSDASHLKMQAEQDGEYYILNGEKSGSTLVTKADGAIVFARTGGPGARGISAIFVPMDLPGITVYPYEDMGGRAIRRGSAFFDNVKVHRKYLFGEEGKGFYTVMNAFDYSRTLLGLMCIGAAQQSLNETMEFVKTREAFGSVLAKFEGVQFPIAEYYTYLDFIRWYAYRALWLRDQGLPHTKEAAMIKWMGPKVSADAIHQCILLNGHMGYTQEMPHEQRLRDVIGLEIGDGTAQIQKIIISREILGREFLPY